MADQEARYDTIAEGYATHWSPVHRAETLRLLDAVEGDVEAGARRILDVGCGTGALAAAAAVRWPAVAVTAVDLSAGMLAVARRELEALPADARRRIGLVQAPADRLPFADGAFDIVLSSFVFQLVPSRHRALREARRVLDPGGRLAAALWLAGGEPFAGDAAFDAALAACGLPPREPDAGPADPASPEAAAAVVRRAGFRGVTATGGLLRHAFTAERFAAFMTEFDEGDRCGALGPRLRGMLDTSLLDRLRGLSEDALVLRLPVVHVVARRGRDRTWARPDGSGSRPG